jgi:hypothetical protein
MDFTNYDKDRDLGVKSRAARTISTLVGCVLVMAVLAACSDAGFAPAETPYRTRVVASGSFDVLHRFSTEIDGKYPQSIVVDDKGRIFGNAAGGLNCGSVEADGCGIVFELAPTATGYAERVVHRFDQGPDGAVPTALSLAPYGRLYGATQLTVPSGCGTVFRLTPARSKKVFETLYAFRGPDGCSPGDAPFVGADGRIYGTTKVGGSKGFGAVFALSPDQPSYVETFEYSFLGGPSGSDPRSLLADAKGNLYGEASAGLNGSIVFELVKTAVGYKERIVRRFARTVLSGKLVFGRDGDLYGTIGLAAGSCGAVFRMDVWGAYRILRNFTGGAEGCSTNSVALGPHGEVFGSNGDGGRAPRRCTSAGCGTIFELKPAGSGYETVVLHRFRGSDGEFPFGIAVSGSTLFGGTTGGGGRRCPSAKGEGCGTVFSLGF